MSFKVDCDYCFDCSCNYAQLESAAIFVKSLMIFTIVPAVLGLYISIRPLFLLKKTTFKRGAKIILLIVTLLLAFNTIVTPVATIKTSVRREAVRQLEVRAKKMGDCIHDIAEYDKKVTEDYYDDANTHFVDIQIVKSERRFF